jgi:hypothetical protein
MSAVCKNCETSFDGRFCPQCGQKSTTGRLTVGHVLEEGWHGVTHTDKSFLSLLGLLIRRPGAVIREYIAGKRKKYFSPWMFYVVVTGLDIFAGKKLYALEDRLYRYHDEFGQLFNEEYELLVLFSIPLVALLYRLIFARGKYNYAEWATVLIFAAGVMNFFGLLVQTGWFAFIKYHREWSWLTGLLSYVVLAYVLISFLQPSRWWQWLQVAASVAVMYGVINYLAGPIGLLLEGLPWDAVQYSF